MGGSVAIITGAADGIGWATARRMARDGARVVLVDLRADAVRERAAELGPEHAWQRADVTSEADVEAAVAVAATRFGRIDILVNNAGISDQSAPTVEQSAEAFDRILAVHVRGTFLFSRAVARSEERRVGKECA